MPSATETKIQPLLGPIRARGHRSFLAPKFGAKVAADGSPLGLSMNQLTADPKLAELGLVVFEQLQQQFMGGEAAAEEGARVEDAETAAYRGRLELWADLLEVFLEETLAELERLGTGGGRT